MISLHAIPPLLAALSSTVLAAIVVARPPRQPTQIAFACDMLAFAMEALAVWSLMTAVNPNEAAIWIRVVHGLSLIVPIPWAIFVITFGRREAGSATGREQPLLVIGCGMTAAVLSFFLPPYTGDADAAGARLSTTGSYSVILQVLATIGILGGLEVS